MSVCDVIAVISVLLAGPAAPEEISELRAWAPPLEAEVCFVDEEGAPMQPQTGAKASTAWPQTMQTPSEYSSMVQAAQHWNSAVALIPSVLGRALSGRELGV